MTEAKTVDGIEERVLEILAELGPERDELTPEASLEELEIDSLDLVEMAQVVEEEFEIEIDMAEMREREPRTIGDILAIIRSHGGG
jgi:acyl carrier protein